MQSRVVRNRDERVRHRGGQDRGARSATIEYGHVRRRYRSPENAVGRQPGGRVVEVGGEGHRLRERLQRGQLVPAIRVGTGVAAVTPMKIQRPCSCTQTAGPVLVSSTGPGARTAWSGSPADPWTPPALRRRCRARLRATTAGGPADPGGRVHSVGRDRRRSPPGRSPSGSSTSNGIMIGVGSRSTAAATRSIDVQESNRPQDTSTQDSSSSRHIR